MSEPARRRIGLLGAGGINALVADAIATGSLGDRIDVVAVAGASADSRSAGELAERLDARQVAPEELVTSGCEWVVEAAGGAAVRQHVPRLWQGGVHTIVMSIGAMIDVDVDNAYRQAIANDVRVILPSGGIAGLDGVRALAAGGELHTVRITTTKAPAGLAGAPFLVENDVELPDDEVIEVFRGSARDAVAGFPANVNVAIALSLAGLGPDATEVVIRSDPAARRTHQLIEVEGAAASLEVQVMSRPSPKNPRTSYLAAASAIAALEQVAGA